MDSTGISPNTAEIQIIEYDKFPALAYRTCKVLPPNFHAAHMAMGLAGEYLELTLANGVDHQAEELGDICWFAGSLAHVFQLKFEPVYLNKQDSLLILAEIIERLANRLKKYSIHEMQFDEQRMSELVCALLANIKERQERMKLLNLEGILSKVIVKLQARYPEKYSDELAAERRDKAEEAADKAAIL